MWDNPRLVEDKARGDWPRICVTGALSPTSCSQIQRWGYLGRGPLRWGLDLIRARDSLAGRVQPDWPARAAGEGVRGDRRLSLPLTVRW